MEIQSKQLNIAEAFKNHYIVPQYQREYVWKDNNVQQLLDDIYSEYSGKNSSEYFIGSIVVWGESNNNFEVIDGQQRLTTLFIALCALANIHRENNDNSHLKYVELLLVSPTYNSDSFAFDQHLILQYEDSNKILEVLLNGADNTEMLETYSKSKNTEAIENIFKAYKFIKEYFSEKNNDDFLKFSDYFLHKVVFMQIKTPSISDALKIFETINERGVGLNPMDLLKNLIFMQLSSSDFEKLNSKWKSITALLEKNKQKPLRFIRYFIMSNFIVKDTSKEADVIREDEIYSWIKRHENECNYKKDPFGFVDKIQENASSYVKFFNTNTDSRDINLAIENIKNLGGPAFSQHYVMLLAAKELPEELFVYFTNQVEKLILYYFVTKTQAKVWEAKFSRWADGLREVIKSNNQSTKLNEFINNYFIPEQERLENEFRSMFLNLRLDSLQKYKIKYILAKISKHVDSIRLGEKGDQGLSYYLKQEVEIEHILPNSPTKDLLELFGGEEIYNSYKNKLGNLTLLEKPHNIVAGRERFSEKISLYEQSNFYLTRSIVKKENVGNNSSVTRTNERLIEFKDWSSDSIDKRQKMLLELALEIWKIKPTNF